MTKISGVVALLLVPVLAAGCSSSDQPEAAPSSPPATSASTPAPDPDFEKPAVGECRLEKVADIPPHSNSTPTVPCGHRHTAVTVAVPMLPATMTFQRKKLLPYVYKVCGRVSEQATGLDGATRAMSILAYSWFIPTKGQRAAGARWVRCDMNAYTYDGDTPHRIYDLPALPMKRLPEELRLCFKGTRSFARVSCSEPHSYRAETAVRYRTHGKKYPSESARHALGESLCTAALHPTGRYSWAYPTELDWTDDRVWFACLLPDEGTAI